MPADELEAESQLEIGHVLFIDIVGYSKLLTDEQREKLEELNRVVRDTEQVRSADASGKLLRLPTGDGMVLAFFTSPDAPARCAIAINRALGGNGDVPLRMGIHSGPVDKILHVDDRPNLAGAGVNIAQRVMNCGDAGHILLSTRSADDLAQHAEWSSRLHDLGEVEIKHGARIGIANLCFDGIGNPALPQKLKLAARAKRRRTLLWLAATLSLVLLALSVGWLLLRRAPPAPSTAETAPVVPEKSIAVLPFESVGGQQEDAFFAEGIHDDVLTSVGKIKELTVIARGSVMAYRGEAAAGKLREIGKALGVAHILQGSIRRSANRVVVNVQLVDTRNDRQLWSERYDRTVDDMLSLQGEVALEIARQLRAALSPAETRMVETKPTENPEAYLVYLRAREIETRNRIYAEDKDRMAAARLYQQAIDLDPKFALAYARRSLCTSEIPNSDAEKKKELFEAQEALRLDPSLGEGYLALGAYHFRELDLETALADLARAEELLPNSVEVWQLRASVYRHEGKIRERIAALQRAEILDPRDGNTRRLLYYTFMGVRQWTDAIRTCDKLRALVPDHIGVETGAARAEFHMTGSIAPLKRLAAQPPPGAPHERVNILRYHVAMLERDYATAETVLQSMTDEQYEKWSPTHHKATEEALLTVARGAAHGTVGKALLAARAKVEQWRPDGEANPKMGELGLIDAFLGRKEEAIAECRRYMQEAERDPFVRNDATAYLALVHARTGDTDEAIKLIEKLLTLPGNYGEWAVTLITVADLKWHWVWDPIRNDPRFQKILAGPEPKTIY